MREHMGLYRGKRKDNGEWVEGGLYEQKEMHESCFFIVRTAVDLYKEEYGHAPAEFFLVDPDTVGECTGLPDKNGKLIFDGDILDRDGARCVVVWCDEECRFVVVFSVCGVKYENIVVENQLKKLKVIGNIHDNPALLGEGG